MQRILVVEDTESLRTVLASVLESVGYEVDAAPSAEEAEALLREHEYSCILCDFKLPKKNGLDLLSDVRSLPRTTPFIIMTAFGTIQIAVEAMRRGANDFLCKPFEPEMLIQVIREVIEHKRVMHRSTIETPARKSGAFLSANPGFNKILAQAEKVAAVDTSVLILGESGTGKELMARFVHAHSARAEQPFIPVNCAAIPSELLESEFFGHEAGSFTGATQSRPGVLELATKGTIFLDEIGDMPLALQVKLLRALQEREIKRVGGTKTIKVNPRLIAATNKPIETALNEGSIREDLYYRIAVVSFTLPPLRDRPEDVLLLSEHFVDHFCKVLKREPLRITESAKQMLRRYAWPGNARELENVMERACILAEAEIRPEHLGLKPVIDFSMYEDATLSLPEIALRAAQQAEKDLIVRTLSRTSGNKTQAAKILGVSYKTLLSKVKEYSLESERH